MCACVALYWEKSCMKGEMSCDGKERCVVKEGEMCCDGRRDVVCWKERCVVMDGEMCCVGKRDVL